MDGKVDGQNVVLLEEGLHQPHTEHGAVIYDDSNFNRFTTAPVDGKPVTYDLAYDELQEVCNVFSISVMQPEPPSINFMKDNTRICNC